MKRSNKNPRNLILFSVLLISIYLIYLLFAGESLKSIFGGGFLIVILFFIYVSIAGLKRLRVPNLKRQVLGTLQLYISIEFLLGILSNSGWESKMTIFQPGILGSIIAKFFILNVGILITLVLVIISFIFSAYIFGSRVLNLEIHKKIQNVKDLRQKTEKPKKIQNRKINIPEPKFENREDSLISILSTVSRAREKDQEQQEFDDFENNFESEEYKLEDTAIEKLDKLLNSFEAGEFNFKPSRNDKKFIYKSKRNRRPFPEVLSNNKNFQNNNNNQYLESEFEEDFESENGAFPPPLEIFNSIDNSSKTETNEFQKIYERQGRILTQALRNFDVTATIGKIIPSYQVVTFEISLSSGTKLSKITNLSEELAMSLGVTSVRIEAPILGTKFVGIEIPVLERKILGIREILQSKEFRKTRTKLAIPLGATTQVNNSDFIVKGLDELTHLLIVGSNRTGKSVFINSCIIAMTWRATPDDLRIILMNTKHVEFSIYEGLPHLLFKPISEPEEAIKALSWTLKEAELRTEKLASCKARNLEAYNLKAKEPLPNIVIILDELSDLMLSKAKETETLIVRIAQKSRALGIFLIISTDKYSPDVITGLIKANIPSKIAFMLPTVNDSRVVLDSGGAEKLTGKGDMLLKTTETPRLLRLQTPMVPDENIPDFVEYMRNIFLKRS